MADFRPERAWGDKRMNKRMNESPPVFYRTLSPSGPLPKSQNPRSQNDGLQTSNKVLWPDLGHFAWVLVILLGFWQFGKICVRIGPKIDHLNVVGEMDIHTDGQMDIQTDPLCCSKIRWIC